MIVKLIACCWGEQWSSSQQSWDSNSGFVVAALQSTAMQVMHRAILCMHHMLRNVCAQIEWTYPKSKEQLWCLHTHSHIIASGYTACNATHLTVCLLLNPLTWACLISAHALVDLPSLSKKWSFVHVHVDIVCNLQAVACSKSKCSWHRPNRKIIDRQTQDGVIMLLWQACVTTGSHSMLWTWVEQQDSRRRWGCWSCTAQKIFSNAVIHHHCTATPVPDCTCVQPL